MNASSRGSLLALLSFAVLINYLDRGALSIAAPILSREMSLSVVQMGLLFSAFFWSYSILQLVAGWMVDRWDGYRVLTGGFLLWSAAIGLMPFVEGFGALFCSRLLLGAGESVSYPAFSSIVVEKFSEGKRAFANSILDASSKLGPVLSTAIGALVVQRFGWRTLFTALTVVSVVWLLPWMVYQRGAMGSWKRQKSAGVPLGQLLRCSQLWSTSAGTFALGYVWTFLLSWLPMYLVNQRGFHLQEVASLGSLPFAVMALVTLGSGWVSDRLIANGASASRVRKTFVTAGLFLCGVAILPVPFCPKGSAMALLTIACAFLGVFTSNVWAVTQTLAGPQAAGAWSGIQNAIGNMGGVVSPYVTGLIISWTGSYTLAFALCSAMLLFGVMAFLSVGRIEPLRWHFREATPEPSPLLNATPGDSGQIDTGLESGRGRGRG